MFLKNNKDWLNSKKKKKKRKKEKPGLAFIPTFIQFLFGFFV